MNTPLVIISAISLLISAASLAAVLLLYRSLRRGDQGRETAELLSRELSRSRQETITTTQGSINSMAQLLTGSQQSLQRTVTDGMAALDERFKGFTLQNDQRMESMRATLESRLRSIQEDNTRQLDSMRKTVDEKLQKSLDEKFNQSFKLVSERLEQVYRGLGEMQTLATGVGDLKKVLSNVKTRGVLGQRQLGAILTATPSPHHPPPRCRPH